MTCKYLLPCGTCEKYERLCPQTKPKRYFVSVTFICKECMNYHEVLFNPTQQRLDLIERHLASVTCDKCGEKLEEVNRSLVEKSITKSIKQKGESK